MQTKIKKPPAACLQANRGQVEPRVQYSKNPSLGMAALLPEACFKL